MDFATVSQKPGRLSRRRLFGYATGSIGTGIFSTVPSVLLLFYMTDTLGLPPGWAATVMFMPKILSIVTDPLIGGLSDRTSSRWGRRKPWLFAGLILLSAGFVLLFRTPPLDSTAARFAWVLGAYTLCSLSYSIFAVPYISIAAELSDTPAERTVIMGWRMSFVIVGLLVGSAGAPFLVQHFGGAAPGYGAMSIILGCLTGLSMLVTLLSAPPDHYRARSPDTGIAHELLSVARDPLLRWLGAMFFLQGMAVSASSASLPYAVIYLLHQDQNLIATLLLCLIVTSCISMALWTKVAIRGGKRAAFIIAALIAALMTASLLPLRTGYPLTLLEAQFALLGVGFSGLQVLPFAMLTDVIQHDSMARGGDRAGAYTGIWIAIEKGGVAAGPVLVAATLAMGGYIQSTGPHLQQPANALLAILCAVSILPVFLFVASAATIVRYPLSEQSLSAHATANTASVT